MKSIHLILTSTAAIVLVGIAALADDSKSEESPAAKAPAKFTNSTPTPAQWDLPSTHRLFVSKKIHEVVTTKGGPSSSPEMKDYEEVAPRANEAKYKMIALKGGEFLMGSPEGEHENRTDDEGPQKKIQIEPFWIGQTEIPWAL